MKNCLKKIYIIVLVFVMFLVNCNYASVTLNQLRGKEHDFANTYRNFGVGPDYILSGDLLVLGDSFSFLLCEYADAELNYIVHQGYTLQQILDEFIEEIPRDRYKYIYLYIGPNDFFAQTNPVDFRVALQIIVNKLKFRGAQVILSNYTEPDYTSSYAKGTIDNKIKCKEYDLEIWQTAQQNDLIYVDTSDLLKQYGKIKVDGIHPSREMYNPLLIKVLNEIILDENKRVG